MSPIPGDIWYVDQPNYLGEYDNVIDNNDRVYMGFPADPEIVYGFGSSMKWKNWDLSFFFQGVAPYFIDDERLSPVWIYHFIWTCQVYCRGQMDRRKPKCKCQISPV